MDNKPLVSILMPARNTEKYIFACIASIVEQAYQNWELIVVDDHSTDKTHELIKSFEENDVRIKYHLNKEQGIIPALSLAFKNSSGELITRMDSDDIMPKHKLDKMVETMPENGKIIVTGKVKYFSNESISEGYQRYEAWLNDLVDKGTYWEFIYRECVIASPNWLAHRNCFDSDIEIVSLNYPEDYDMVFKWYKLGYTIKGIDEVTHMWREHQNRTSRHDKAYQQESFFNLKTNYFIDLECFEDQSVQLIGAGGKGKLVAQVFINRNRTFEWFDYEAHKYQAPLNGIEIQAIIQLKSNVNTILTVWPNDLKLQREISSYLENRGLVFGKNLFLF